MTTDAKSTAELLIDLEVDSFCYGLRAFPGKLSQALVYRVLKEMTSAFRTAFEQLEAVDLLSAARRLSEAAGFVLNEKEVVFYLSLLFPLPEQLDEDSQCCMAQVLDLADQKYPTLLSELEDLWKEERAKQFAKAIKDFSSSGKVSEPQQLRL